MKSTNGGFNWTACINPPTIGESKLFFLDSLHGWAGCGVNKILCVKDGTNWFYQYSPSFNSYSVMFVDSTTGWAGSTSLVHTSDGGGPPVGIEIISTEVPDEYKLYQNYPNPFNPTTKINYDLPRDAKVTIIIYDILGQEVKRLVNNDIKKAGTYILDFNAQNYASGVYFYRIEAEENNGFKFVDSKKMVLIK